MPMLGLGLSIPRIAITQDADEDDVDVNQELREDGFAELREDGSLEIRE